MPKGYKDPHRRERIAKAAIEVLAQAGVEGLTHRAVASAADVPLGSTTYYFKTLDDLLSAAVVEAKTAWDERLNAWTENLSAAPDIAADLAELLVLITESGRDRLVVEYELYMAAARRPALQSLSMEWDEALESVLAQYTDPVTAKTLALAADGITLQSLIRGKPLTIDEVEPLLRRIIR